ncbi:hypothetical protein [Novosphingobium sp. 9]|uniref:hypothetical protein n=1 Tax=Novosphingobium sp. 9 TaxID=2025349 RepID=UPI0021B5787C|nr:hypothetical protein [Novosphingobium sp. 9]
MAATRTGHSRQPFRSGTLVLGAVYLGAVAALCALAGARNAFVGAHFWALFTTLHAIFGLALNALRKPRHSHDSIPAENRRKMMHDGTTPTTSHDGAWFAPKRFGYGSGLPIAWQGWLTYGLYFALVFALGFWGPYGGENARLGSLVLILLTTGLLIVVCAKKTRGGWKWRSGKPD